MRLGNRHSRRAALAVLTSLVVVLSSSLAFADVVSNDVTIDTGTGVKTRTIVEGGSANVTYSVTTTDASDPVNGCNATGSAPATFTVNAPSAVTATPSSWTRTGCTSQIVSFSSSTPGDYVITMSVTGGRDRSTWNTAPATFTLKVESASTPDTTDPVVTVPADITAEASSGAGAAVTFTASATDDIDGPLTPVCEPASGSTFPLGATTVTCSATDTAGNTGSASFEITVVDTTDPVVSAPADIVAEATGASGATVTYAGASATDSVDGSLSVDCTPSSGSTFPLGATTVTCSATDDAGNTGSDTFTITVQDTTAPTVTAPADITAEATSSAGATVTYANATASDLVDGAVTASCSPASGSTFPLGTSTVTCSATDNGGNTGYDYFDITVEDTTGPVVTAPADIAGVEATGPGGSVVTYSGATAEDAVDGSLTPACLPASGSTFALGTTIVTCSATDNAGNTGQDTFSITVVDTTPPTVIAPADITAEATGPTGAAVSYSGATANDIVDGDLAPICSPASGSTFALGATTVTCSATDDAGNTGSATFTITVVDTTPPTVTPPADITAEATGPGGASVTYPAATASDLVDGVLTPACLPSSGSTFALGATTVTCSATDDAGNTGSATFTITVVDTTPPAVTVPANQIVEATGPSGATVTFSASASDLVDGAITPTCTPSSGSTFSLGTTLVTCSATDEAGNSGSASFDVSVVDTTAPAVTVPANILAYATSSAGAAVGFTSSASDVVDGALSPACVPPSGSTFAPGVTTVTCSATDDAGNTGSASFLVTVGFDYSGFFAPVDRGIHNIVKAGATVPLKFNVRAAGGGYIRDLSIVAFKTATIPCDSTIPGDEVELTSTGGTQLRYDLTAEQFIQNWQTPKLPGKCARATITLTDGSRITADFRLK